MQSPSRLTAGAPRRGAQAKPCGAAVFCHPPHLHTGAGAALSLAASKDVGIVGVLNTEKKEKGREGASPRGRGRAAPVFLLLQENEKRECQGFYSSFTKNWGGGSRANTLTLAHTHSQP